MTTTVRSADRLSEAEAAGVLELAAAAEREDGVYPLSEDTVLRVRVHGGSDPDPATHLLSFDEDGTLAGYAFVADGSGELVVRPSARRRGFGTALLDGVRETGNVKFWAHGDEPGAQAFAEKNGFTRDRVLWQMRRSLTEPLPAVPMPAGVTLRHFRPGLDEERWLEINAAAFAHHPEQGRWTIDDLRLREAEPWFDPAGFLLAVDVADKLLGFHWTKVHPATAADPALGEIYVLGVDPSGHRKGLGAALSVAGLEHLAGQGLTAALLYVDESNPAAVALYRRLGFEIYKTDVQFAR